MLLFISYSLQSGEKPGDVNANPSGNNAKSGGDAEDVSYWGSADFENDHIQRFGTHLAKKTVRQGDDVEIPDN